MHLRGNRFCQFSKICLNFLIFHYNFWNELLHLKYILILLKQGQMCTFLSSCLSLLKFFKLYTVQASPNFDFLIVFCWIWHFLIIPSITYLVPGTADDGGEDSPGGIITSETSLAHAGAIVNDESSNVLISHFGFVLLNLRLCHTTTADLGLSKKSKICVWHQLSFGPAHTPFQLTKVAKITPLCHNAHTQNVMLSLPLHCHAESMIIKCPYLVT